MRHHPDYIHKIAVSAAKPCVYVLVDPREPDHVRYVGQTISPETRLATHLKERGGSPKQLWVSDLAASGIQPEMWIVEECSLERLDDRELWWIGRMDAEGHELLNKLPPKHITKYGVRYSRDLGAVSTPPPRSDVVGVLS